MFGSHGRFRTEAMEQGRRRLHPARVTVTRLRTSATSPCRVLIGFNTGVYETIDLSQWIAGNPLDVLATNFSKPESLFEKFPKKDVFIADKTGR